MPVHQLSHDLPPVQPCLDVYGNTPQFALAIPPAGQGAVPPLSCEGHDEHKRGGLIMGVNTA